MNIPKSWEDWGYGLVGGCIGGGASAASVYLGLAAAHGVGLDVPRLNLKGVAIVFLSGVLTHGFAFLQKSPLPSPTTGETEFLTKQTK